MFRSDQFRIERLGDGVWAAVALPVSGASSNSGIVDLGNESVVFDTFLTPKAAKDLRAAARLLTGKDPDHVVNSHWHLDHTLGNGIFGSCSFTRPLAPATR